MGTAKKAKKKTPKKKAAKKKAAKKKAAKKKAAKKKTPKKKTPKKKAAKKKAAKKKAAKKKAAKKKAAPSVTIATLDRECRKLTPGALRKLVEAGPQSTMGRCARGELERRDLPVAKPRSTTTPAQRARLRAILGR